MKIISTLLVSAGFLFSAGAIASIAEDGGFIKPQKKSMTFDEFKAKLAHEVKVVCPSDMALNIRKIADAKNGTVTRAGVHYIALSAGVKGEDQDYGPVKGKATPEQLKSLIGSTICVS